MPDINIGQISEALNNKADRDLSNISSTSNFRRLIEVYSNGTNWYKVFAEYNPTTGDLIGKWCEQGGKYYNNNTAISFLKPFTNTNYSIITQCTDSYPNDGIYQTCWTDKTTTGFIGWITYGNSLGSGVETDWHAFGYVL